MNIKFEALDDIEVLIKMVSSIQEILSQGNIEKRWFNTRELSTYTGYKYETIKSKIKQGEFILGVHYYKKGGMLFFDKIEVDNWIMGIKSANNLNYEKEEKNSIVNDVLSSFEF